MPLEVTKPIAVSTATAAALLDVSQASVNRRIRRGQIPAHKFGSTWRINVSDLEAIAPAAQRSADTAVR